MHFSWQDIAVAAVVIVSAAYLIYRGRLLLARKKSSGCGGDACGGCGSGESDQAPRIKPLIGVDQLKDLTKEP